MPEAVAADQHWKRDPASHARLRVGERRLRELRVARVGLQFAIISAGGQDARLGAGAILLGALRVRKQLREFRPGEGGGLVGEPAGIAAKAFGHRTEDLRPDPPSPPVTVQAPTPAPRTNRTPLCRPAT